MLNSHDFLPHLVAIDHISLGCPELKHPERHPTTLHLPIDTWLFDGERAHVLPYYLSLLLQRSYRILKRTLKETLEIYPNALAAAPMTANVTA